MSSFIDNLSPPLEWKLYEGRLSLLGSLLYLWSQEGSLASWEEAGAGLSLTRL